MTYNTVIRHKIMSTFLIFHPLIRSALTESLDSGPKLLHTGPLKAQKHQNNIGFMNMRDVLIICSLIKVF